MENRVKKRIKSTPNCESELDIETTAALERNVTSYRGMSVLEAVFALGLPIFVPLWKSSGLTMGEIFLLQGLFALAIVLSEVPTGYMADILGRRRSLVIGYVCIATSCILYINADSFWSYLGAEVLVGIGFSFRSGADLSLMFESLRRLGREREYLRITSRTNSQFFMASATLTVLGGVLGSIDVRLPLVAIAAVTIVQFYLALKTVEPVGLTPSHHPYLKEIALTTRSVLVTNKRTRWFAIPPALVGGSLVVSLWLYQPTFERVGISIEYVGVLFAIQNVVAALGSRCAPWIARTMSDSRMLVCCAAIMVVGYTGMSSSATAPVILGGCLLQLARVMPGTILGGELQHAVASARRATVMSLASMLNRFCGFVAMLSAMLLSYELPDQGVLLVWGACSSALLLVCLALLKPPRL